MRLLLDTHAFLWWITDDARMSSAARTAIGDARNDVLLSIASVWEMAIKSGLGRLDLPADLTGFIDAQVKVNGFRLLGVELPHLARVRALPNNHRDPFDRLLVATAIAEAITLVSVDGRLGEYGAALLW